MPEIQIIPFGDRALLVNFEPRIDLRINRQVVALNRALLALTIPGLEYTTPAYCSLTIGFNPGRTTFAALKDTVVQLAGEGDENSTPETEGRRLIIPVCYAPEFAPDRQEVEEVTGLPFAAIIRLHTETLFRVYMLGFLPGFAYMGKTPAALHCPRKREPRLSVPEGAVGLAGSQTGIYPVTAPGGWQLIGRTPLRIFDDRLDQPFLFQPGDTVQFREIDRHTFEAIRQAVRRQTFDLNHWYE